MRCVTLIPIYKDKFTPIEEYNVCFSMRNLIGQDCCFFWLAPETINREYYERLLPHVRWSIFSDSYFNSVRDYSRLLISDMFYEHYLNYEFLLIMQPDAMVLKKTLNEWLSKPYDWIGAPWPNGWECALPIRIGNVLESITCRAFVGNGGLSLRKPEKILNLLRAFPEARESWANLGNPEDVLISMLATISENIIVPTIGEASRFSVELDLDFFVRALGRQNPPFGTHGVQWPSINKS